MLGVLKADAIYVPLHERWPQERCARILKDCRRMQSSPTRRTADRMLAALDGSAPRPALFRLETPASAHAPSAAG